MLECKEIQGKVIYYEQSGGEHNFGSLIIGYYACLCIAGVIKFGVTYYMLPIYTQKLFRYGKSPSQ